MLKLLSSSVCTVQSKRGRPSLLTSPPVNLIICPQLFCEGFHFPGSDCDPGVVHIPEPVARRSFCEGDQGSALKFFQVEVGHYWQTPVSPWPSCATVCTNLHCTGRRWSSDRGHVSHQPIHSMQQKIWICENYLILTCSIVYGVLDLSIMK